MDIEEFNRRIILCHNLDRGQAVNEKPLQVHKEMMQSFLDHRDYWGTPEYKLKPTLTKTVYPKC